MAVLEVIKSYREMFKKNRWRVILAIIVLVILIWTGYVWLVIGRWPDWTGFGTKTLWDFMELLIIPAILAGGAYWLNESARQQGIKIASDNRQETALQTYLDNMTELLLDKKLRESEVDSEVRAVARARTFTVLRRLDEERKGALLRFLYGAHLIDKDKVVIYLAGADLHEADLHFARLIEADMTLINLSGADISESNLTGARLVGANLTGANLNDTGMSGANMYHANMYHANLSGTNMNETDLRGAYISGVDLSHTDLIGAKYSKNAPDCSDTIWPDGFDPVAVGAICVNE